LASVVLSIFMAPCNAAQHQRWGLEWAYRLYLEPWRLKRISSSFVFMLEATMDALVGRAPVLGGTSQRDTPPAWRGKGSV
jgi:hypothetical protein